MSAPRWRGPGRRGLRDEVQSTWSVYDAVRPIRQEDLEPVVQPEDLAEPSPPVVGRDPNRAPPPDEGTTPASQFALSEDFLSRIEQTSDAEVAKVFGVTEMDAREARKWARAQAATVEASKPGSKH